MIRVVENTVKYFRAPSNYFWCWADNATAIEWQARGGTICFRDDLAAILRPFPDDQLPRIGAVLFVLYACNNRISSVQRFGILRAFNMNYSDLPEAEEVFSFLEKIHSLSPSMRTGNKRMLLMREVFLNSGVSYSLETYEASISELGSGRIAEQLMKAGEAVKGDHFLEDLRCLLPAARRFPTFRSLELLLEAGVEALPEPPSIETPEELHSEDLFDQLLGIPETAGLSRLARRLLSIIHIPIHARAGGEDSYGGIADITNRGNYDRLLLSELAQDELLLTARLVNNEALYFRREEPPAEPRTQRIILIDSTIKMWGVPRVFAVAAALAFARNSKHGEQVDAYVLNESTYEKISLSDKTGVVDALTKLHPALHSGKALQLAIRELNQGDKTEFILITENRQLKHAGFYADFFKIKEWISFVITVDREGDIRFAEYSNGHSKTLSEAKLDLNELLFPSQKSTLVKTNYSKLVEQSLTKADFAFFAKPLLPLLMPKKRAAMKERLMGVAGDGSVILIDRNNRLLRLTSSNRGAAELMDNIEQGQYFMHIHGSVYCCIVILGINGFVKIYKIHIGSGEVVCEDLSAKTEGVYRADFEADQSLRLVAANKPYRYDYEEMKMVNQVSQPDSGKKAVKIDVDLNYVAQLLRSPDFIGIFKVDRIYINKQLRLVIADKSLGSGSAPHPLRFDRNTVEEKRVESGPAKEDFFRGTHIKYRKMEWPDGSVAVLDKRGLLHLKSSDPAIPQVTIVAVGRLPTAAWSSDNVVAGYYFFLDSQNKCEVVTEIDFYNKYIDRYINHIIKHAASSSI